MHTGKVVTTFSLMQSSSASVFGITPLGVLSVWLPGVCARTSSFSSLSGERSPLAHFRVTFPTRFFSSSHARTMTLMHDSLGLVWFDSVGRLFVSLREKKKIINVGRLC
jgi:hypothetical protein